MANITKIHFTMKSILSDIMVCEAGYQQFSTLEAKNSGNPFEKSEYGAYKRYSLHLVVSGQGEYTIKGKTYYLKKGQMFALFPQDVSTYYPNKRYPWKYFWLDFIGVKSEQLLAQIGLTPDSPVLDTGDSYKILEKLFLTNLTTCKNNPKIADVHAVSTLLQIYCEFTKKKTQVVESDKKTDGYAKKAMAYMQKNFSNPNLNLKLVSAHLNLNEAYLSRLFRADLNINFIDYLTKIRILAAVNLIEEGAKVVGEIATAVGFSDPYYFSKVFKKYNSISPREQIQLAQKRLQEKREAEASPEE